MKRGGARGWWGGTLVERNEMCINFPVNRFMGTQLFGGWSLFLRSRLLGTATGAEINLWQDWVPVSWVGHQCGRSHPCHWLAGFRGRDCYTSAVHEVTSLCKQTGAKHMAFNSSGSEGGLVQNTPSYNHESDTHTVLRP